MKETFKKIFTEQITREGAHKLLEWLEKSDFFTAPASTRYHLACEGGLCRHSINVYERLCKELDHEYGENSPYSRETAAIAGLLHDVCKVQYYKTEYRNVKNEQSGQWEKVPFYTVDDQLPYGHGEKSVYIISGFMRLTREESMAIRWHMGGFDDSVRGGSFSLSAAYEKFPLAVLLGIADLKASYMDELRD